MDNYNLPFEAEENDQNLQKTKEMESGELILSNKVLTINQCRKCFEVEKICN